MQPFKTHTGEIVTGERLQQALDAVSNDWIAIAYGVRGEDLYADHVTEEQKNARFNDNIKTAKNIRNGTEPMGFWLWQRINQKLTGECIAMLPK